MSPTITEAERALEAFLQDYLARPAHSQYLHTGFVSRLRFLSQLNKLENSKLGPGESLDDYCIDAVLREVPPNGVTFPPFYQNVRVVCEVPQIYRPI